MFENKVLRKMSGHGKDEVNGKWRILPNKELSDLGCVVLLMKSRSPNGLDMRGTKCMQVFLWGRMLESRHLED
jgi:hypothetical protein